MPRNRKMPLVNPQSFSVSDEEQLAIEVLAKSEGLKPGTFVRRIFIRGLAEYSEDRVVGENETAEEKAVEVFGRVMRMIKDDAQLRDIKAFLIKGRELDASSKAGRVYASRNLSDEGSQQTGSKKSARKSASKR